MKKLFLILVAGLVLASSAIAETDILEKDVSPPVQIVVDIVEECKLSNWWLKSNSGEVSVKCKNKLTYSLKFKGSNLDKLNSFYIKTPIRSLNEQPDVPVILVIYKAGIEQGAVIDSTELVLVN